MAGALSRETFLSTGAQLHRLGGSGVGGPDQGNKPARGAQPPRAAGHRPLRLTVLEEVRVLDRVSVHRVRVCLQGFVFIQGLDVGLGLGASDSPQDENGEINGEIFVQKGKRG